ncbi:MAG TPA: hypothetical protein VHP58_03000 [Alphaproteobacteria bacterium]|nr:hypothetical protein [Alphaproteobacteria bacterium]
MSGPKFRFTIVVGLLLVVWWAFEVVNTYLVGEHGLNFTRYSNGVMVIGAATLGGFALVWLAVQIAAWSRGVATGFEPEVVDEYGTTFKMGEGAGYSVSLSKFLPEIIAPPVWPGLSALEAELIGFLNGYRHWPYNLGHTHPTLYEEALARWEIMRSLPGSGPLQRASALASVLSKVVAYSEVRNHHPLRQFWKRDRVRFERRCREHGGLAAFVLSTLPAFRALSNGDAEAQRARRAMTTALRYYDVPGGLPVNVDATTRDLSNALQRLVSKRRSTGTTTPPGPAEEALLRQNIRTLLPTLLDEWQRDVITTDTTDAVPLPGGRLLVRVAAILGTLGSKLPVELREQFDLWENTGSIEHPTWPTVLASLEALHFVAPWDDLTPLAASFKLGDVVFGPAVVIDFAAGGHPEVSGPIARGVVFDGLVDVVLDGGTAVPLLQARADTLAAQLKDKF